MSKEHPLRELLVLVGGVFGVLLLAYLVLGFAPDLVVARIDPEIEARLGSLLFDRAGGDLASPPPLQGLLDDLAALQGLPAGSCRVRVVHSDDANAVALPGGLILIHSGLLARASSENEVAMVLGHELGHYRQRDHLRGLGRGLVLVFLSSMVFGSGSAPSRLAGTLLTGAQMRFSRHEELGADAWGLERLVRKYGHAGGAVDFFVRADAESRGGRVTGLFSTHPYPQVRIGRFRKAIDERRIPLEETVPLNVGAWSVEAPRETGRLDGRNPLGRGI